MNLQPYTTTAENAQADERAAFIRKTYAHLAGAVFLFMALEFYLVNSSIGHAFLNLLAGSQYSWLIVMVAFVGVSYISNKWARSSTSQAMQYAGLGLFIVVEAIVFLPVLYMAANYYEGIIQMAGIMTCLLVGGLTYTAVVTRKDFSFLGPILGIGGIVAIGFIVCSILFGFSLGLVFSSVMILFAAGSILYETSNIIHHYRTDQHVAASLSLFASVALLFFYVLRTLMALQKD